MQIIPLLAEASDAFIGQWALVAGGGVSLLGGLIALGSYFATKRELEALVTRMEKLEEFIEAVRNKAAIDIDLIQQQSKTDMQLFLRAGEDRAEKLHIRMNPIAIAVAEMRGQMQAFTQSFDNFTKILVSQNEKKS